MGFDGCLSGEEDDFGVEWTGSGVFKSFNVKCDGSGDDKSGNNNHSLVNGTTGTKNRFGHEDNAFAFKNNLLIKKLTCMTNIIKKLVNLLYMIGLFSMRYSKLKKY